MVSIFINFWNAAEVKPSRYKRWFFQLTFLLANRSLTVDKPSTNFVNASAPDPFSSPGGQTTNEYMADARPVEEKREKLYKNIEAWIHRNLRTSEGVERAKTTRAKIIELTGSV